MKTEQSRMLCDVVWQLHFLSLKALGKNVLDLFKVSFQKQKQTKKLKKKHLLLNGKMIKKLIDTF